MEAVLLEPSGEVLSLPAPPCLLLLQRPHFISRKSHLLCQFSESVILLRYTTVPSMTPTRKWKLASISHVIYWFCTHMMERWALYLGGLPETQTMYLSHAHKVAVCSLESACVNSFHRFVYSSVSAFCITGCVSNSCLGFSTCVWFKKTGTDAKEARSGSRYSWHYLYVTEWEPLLLLLQCRRKSTWVNPKYQSKNKERLDFLLNWWGATGEN